MSPSGWLKPLAIAEEKMLEVPEGDEKIVNGFCENRCASIIILHSKTAMTDKRNDSRFVTSSGIRLDRLRPRESRRLGSERVNWALRVNHLSPEGTTPPATEAGSGRCVSMPVTPPPTSRTAAIATFSSRVRAVSRSLSICPPRSATTPTTPWPEGEVGKGRCGHRFARRHGALVRPHPTGSCFDLDDHQRHRRDPSRPLRRRGTQAGSVGGDALRHGTK